MPLPRSSMRRAIGRIAVLTPIADFLSAARPAHPLRGDLAWRRATKAYDRTITILLLSAVWRRINTGKDRKNSGQGDVDSILCRPDNNQISPASAAMRPMDA